MRGLAATVFAAGLALAAASSSSSSSSSSSRSFAIANDSFLRDGAPFRIMSGSFHYSRADPSTWVDRLQRLRAMGLNAVQTYVFWNFHEQVPGQFDFSGARDLAAFANAAQDAGLLILLRLGPYGCGEWEGGGLPSWMLSANPAPQIRTNDSTYLQFVDRWWSVLLPYVKSKGLLYEDGGPVIMAQLENEYGSYGDVASNPADRAYMEHLHALARQYLGPNLVLYTTDGGDVGYMSRGSLNSSDVLTVGDFGPGSDPSVSFAAARQFNAPGKSPNFCSEFYSGWLTHWGESMANQSSAMLANALDGLFALNGSVNLYMGYGGSNFGYWNGANGGGTAFQPVIQSYDYDSPLSEGGQHGYGSDNADKYAAVQAVLLKWIAHDGGQAPPPEPPAVPKANYGMVNVTGQLSLWDAVPSSLCPSPVTLPAGGSLPTFESLGVYHGFVLFSGHVPASNGTLTLSQLHDRAQVFVNQSLVGTAWRPNGDTALGVAGSSAGAPLQVLVEEMGRINYGGQMFDNKGVTGGVQWNGAAFPASAGAWTACPLPLNPANVTTLPFRAVPSGSSAGPITGPVFVSATLTVSTVQDTYLATYGWGKGQIWVNGQMLGRYWERLGPQHTFYIPAAWLTPGANQIVLFELEQTNANLTLQFVDAPDFHTATASCAPDAMPANGDLAVTFTCSASLQAAQTWSYVSADQSWRPTSNPDLCLTEGVGTDPTSGYPAAGLRPCSGSASQSFAYASASEEVTVKSDGNCLDITSHVSEDGARVEFYPCNGGTNQMWALSTSAPTTLVTQQDGRCLTVCTPENA